MNVWSRLCLALSYVLPVTAALAQEAASQPEGVYVMAQPLERSPPNYPAVAIRDRREGWVLVSFIISEQGEVIEPMIEDSSSPDFDESALRAIRKWRYTPATQGGKPVEQSMVQTMIRYRISDAKGAKPEFVRKYRTINNLISEKKLAEAGPLIESLGKGELNYYEQAWYSWLRYYHLEAAGGAEASALEEPLRKALDSSQDKDDDYLTPDMFVVGAQRLLALRARAGDLSGALAVYEQLKASTNAKRSKLYPDAIRALESVHAEIMRLVAGTGILQQPARVDEHNYWVHRMLRRSFSFGDVKSGKLDLVDVRCSRANRRFVSLPPGAVLKIPDSWGDCSVYIKGDPGTQFAFEEYPAGYVSSIDPAQVKP